MLVAPVVLVGGLGASGDERGRETEEGEGMQRVRERREGTRGVVVARIRTEGGLQREAGGGRGARARATPRLCLLAEEEEDKGERWAGPCWWGGKLGRLVGYQVRPGKFYSYYFVLFCFLLILCHCFSNLNKFKTVPNIL